MRVAGFCAGSNTPLSRSINTEFTVNLVVEKDPGTTKTGEPVLLGRPALVPWTCCGPGPVRSMFWQDDRMFAVSGGFYYEINHNRSVTPIGAVSVDNNPSTISTNGTGGFQNFITSGGQGYIHTLNTNAFAQITDAEFLTPAASGMYFEGYFLNLQRGTNTFQLSTLFDGLEWNGLDTGQCSLTSDQKNAMALNSRTLFFAGQKNIEPWQNTGNASFPIQPEAGVVIEHGIAAPYTFTNLDNTLYWLGQDQQGRGLAWRFNGYTPELIGSFPQAVTFQEQPTLEDARAYTFQTNGHAFWVLDLPHHDTTPVYDASMNVWTDWAEWDVKAMRWVPFNGRCAASGWNQTFIGSRNSGVIYTLSWDDYSEEVVW